MSSQQNHHDATLRAHLIKRGLLVRGPHNPAWAPEGGAVLRLDWRAVQQAAEVIWQKERAVARRLMAEGNPDHPLVRRLAKLAEFSPSD